MGKKESSYEEGGNDDGRERREREKIFIASKALMASKIQSQLHPMDSVLHPPIPDGFP